MALRISDLTAETSPTGTMEVEIRDGSNSRRSTIANIISNNLPASIPLDLGALREIASNDIDTSANHGGLLTSDSTPTYSRVNGATDKALRVEWAISNVDEVQFAPLFMPPDLDETVDVSIHLLAEMSGATDTPTIDVQVFDGVGDTEMGGATGALSSTLAEVSTTIGNADVSGHPTGFLNISLIPGAHGTDTMRLYAAWFEYTRKSA